MHLLRLREGVGAAPARVPATLVGGRVAREPDQEGRQGGKLVTTPITSTVRAILWPLRGHHPEHVFTYVAERTRAGKIRGRRYPLTYSGVKITWRRLCKVAGV